MARLEIASPRCVPPCTSEILYNRLPGVRCLRR